MASSSTTMCYGSCLASKGSSKRLQANSPAIGTSPSSTMVAASSRIGGGTSYETRDDKLSGLPLCRRSLVLSGIPLVSSLVGLEFPPKGAAVVKQSLLAGRVPGLSEPDEEVLYEIDLFGRQFGWSGEHTDRMKSLEAMVLDGIQLSPILFQFQAGRGLQWKRHYGDLKRIAALSALCNLACQNPEEHDVYVK
ncbi:PsbP domain-containing protein [Drosera capensis]